MGKAKRGYDIVIANKFIKELIRKRANELGISVFSICQELGVDWFWFKRYLTATNPIDWANSIKVKQEEVIRVAKQLGIEIRLELILHNNIDIERYRVSKEDLKKEQRKMMIAGSVAKMKYNKDDEELLEELAEQEEVEEIKTSKSLTKDEII